LVFLYFDFNLIILLIVVLVLLADVFCLFVMIGCVVGLLWVSVCFGFVAYLSSVNFVVCVDACL